MFAKYMIVKNKRIEKSFSNFTKILPFALAVKLTVLYALKKFLRIPVKFAFSQTGEDLILDVLMQDRKVFYVDVGCNDPIDKSSTFKFYLEGSRGICIDANPQLVEKFRKVRKNDIVINAAVSDVEEEVTFFISDEAPAVSTLDTKTLKEWSKSFKFSREIVLKTRTLHGILVENLPIGQDIDILSIDVEGHDYNVLKSINLKIYRPKIIVIEVHNLSLDTIQEQELVTYLRKNKYQLIHLATMNAYFVDLENKNI
jgi:FkbM family methyltransferase